MAISPSSGITLTLLGLALGIFAYFAANNVYDFFNQPYVLTTSHIPAESMEMPKITLCPVAWLDQKVLEYDSVLIEFLMNGFMDSMLVATAYENNQPYSSDTSLSERVQMYDAFLADNPDFNVRTFLQNQQSACKSQLVECVLGNESYVDQCCDDFVTPRVLKNVGGCWSMDGYLKQEMPGPGGGLTLYLTTGEMVPKIIRSTLPTVGYVLFVDDKPALSRSRPIFVNDDTLTAVGLWATQHVSVTDCESAENYPKTKFFEHMNYTVSKELCIYDCMLNKIGEQCHCVLFTESASDILYPYCTPQKIETCVISEMLRPYGTKMHQECDSLCPKLCSYTEYNWETSYSTVNTDLFGYVAKRQMEALGGARKRRQLGGGGMDGGGGGGGDGGGGMDGGGMDGGGMGTGKTGKESVVLTIYMAQIGYTLKEEQPTATWSALVSNIGGQIGMWLGLSLLSLQEILLKLYRKRCEKRSTRSSGRQK